ncbi:hypothetical protein JTE90_020360 [Oedothorax gibbosus]|uniref:Uncharacterized protein n=1 Tax=Oedothorax gibbosus TaxID=931172 RepID=A0AAV6TE21_9ARAC|nr:hypothetical protein JTE90_020360 [Oedothorax gibbosus]
MSGDPRAYPSPKIRGGRFFPIFGAEQETPVTEKKRLSPGDLAWDMGTEPARKLHYLPRISRAQQSAPDPQETRCFYEHSVPISDEPIPGHELLQEKKLFPGSRRRLEFGCVPHLGPKDYLCSGLGHIKPFFRVGQRDKHEHVSSGLRFGRTSRSERFIRSP